MIRVTVELVSAITGRTTVIGTAKIWNDGTGTPTSGNYRAKFYGKNGRPLKFGDSELTNFPRKRLNVWALIARLLVQRR